tara:strand:- start:702 stop:1334 length:633 start_codon:yes stop_codon:yes gene_type:complete
MLNYKKEYLNILLGVVLIGLMYHTPSFLMDVTTNMLGRLSLVIVLAYLVLRCDFSCAVIFSIIIIVLFHNTVEGFKEGKDDDKKKKKSKDEDEEDEDEDEEDEDSAKDQAKGVVSDTGAAFGADTEQSINTPVDLLVAAKKNGDGVTKEVGPLEDEKKEGFLGMNLAKHVLSKKGLNSLRDNLFSNVIDMDRYLKTSAERNSISASKDHH